MLLGPTTAMAQTNEKNNQWRKLQNQDMTTDY